MKEEADRKWQAEAQKVLQRWLPGPGPVLARISMKFTPRFWGWASQSLVHGTSSIPWEGVGLER